MEDLQFRVRLVIVVAREEKLLLIVMAEKQELEEDVLVQKMQQRLIGLGLIMQDMLQKTL